MRCPVTRISSACLCTRSRDPCAASAWCTLLPCCPARSRHRSLIEPTRVDHRLDRAARGQHGHHHHHPFCWRAQSVPRGSTASAKGVTARALPSAIMDVNSALSDVASCGTRQIRVPLSGRVPWLFSCVFHPWMMPRTVLFFKGASIFTASWCCTAECGYIHLLRLNILRKSMDRIACLFEAREKHVLFLYIQMSLLLLSKRQPIAGLWSVPGRERLNHHAESSGAIISLFPVSNGA